MLGKIEYDVEVPEIKRPVSDVELFLIEFMNESHKSASVDYSPSDLNANNASKRFGDISKKHGFDVTVNKRGCVVYVTKNGSISEQEEVDQEESETEEVVIPDSVSSKKKSLDVGKVMALHRAKWTQKQIAEEMGCSQALICQTIKANRK